LLNYFVKISPYLPIYISKLISIRSAHSLYLDTTELLPLFVYYGPLSDDYYDDSYNLNFLIIFSISWNLLDALDFFFIVDSFDLD